MKDLDSQPAEPREGKDFFEWLEEDRAWRNTWRGLFVSTLYYPIRRFLLDNFWDFRWYHQGIKAFWQRGRRGWADCDLWSFDHYLAELIGSGLSELAKLKPGVSSGFMPSVGPDLDEERALVIGGECQGTSYKRWAHALTVYAFYNDNPDDDDWFFLPKGKARDKALAKVLKKEELVYQEACQAIREMADHFGGLWT